MKKTIKKVVVKKTITKKQMNKVKGGSIVVDLIYP